MISKQDKVEFNPSKFEPKWQLTWESDKIFAPDLEHAQKPYMNLMMFPYPSAEGLHVGNMYAQTGADVYGRLKRMQGYDVYIPMGLDGFGIHSENYALKVGVHPIRQAKIAQERFYKQMKAVGTSVDWSRTLETYDPRYYKWTQWLFIRLFKAGLAYRKKAEVNWCPSCKTVLSDEQVIDGKCERCSSIIEKRKLEQWFFRITNYAERLLGNINGLDWTESVKIAQKNWIGKKTGVVIAFPIDEKYRFVNLHGFTGSPDNNFFPWLKQELEKKGYAVENPRLPDADTGNVEKQAQYVIDNYTFDQNTILFGHSLGSVVALKVLEKLDKPIKRLVLAAGFAEPGFLDTARPFEKATDWKFDFEKIKKNAGEVILLRAENDTAVPQERATFIQQKIGGTIIDFKAQEDHMCGNQEPEILKNITPSIQVFTTRPDTLYGATFLVVAPEHPFVAMLLRAGSQKEVADYIKLAKSKSNQERTDEGKEKTGVFSGVYATNPVNGEKIPVWIADYVLMGYGTGAIMAVPAHDKRDYDFAKKHKLPIIEVVESGHPLPYVGDGVLINSGDWNGLKMPEQLEKIIAWLEKKGLGEKLDNYHLRDWLISRQRYWGPPIPMIYCESCFKNGKGESEEMLGWYSVSDADLPVLLPDVEDWKPMGTGLSPLANHPEFYETICPGCGGKAKRETDVSDTFLDSAWYFLGYISDSITARFKNPETVSRDIKVGQMSNVKSQKLGPPWTKNVQEKWLPVKKYIGGAEHSVLHLLYARFISMVLADLKLTDFEEPFSSFFAHGLIIKDGAKMSKSKGNVVVPDTYIEKYGADTLRTYLMFLGPFSDGGDFRDSGIEGMYRFLKRVWTLLQKSISNFQFPISNKQSLLERTGDFSKELSNEANFEMNKAVKKVTEDIEAFKYNTAISAIMEWYNYLSKIEGRISNAEIETFLKLLAPFAPYMTEELWERVSRVSKVPSVSKGKKKQALDTPDTHGTHDTHQSIHLEKWPEYDEKYLVSSETTIVVQVNGKKRSEFTVHSSRLTDEEKIKAEAKLLIEKYLEGKEIKKVIYVSGKIVNFVV